MIDVKGRRQKAEGLQVSLHRRHSGPGNRDEIVVVLNVDKMISSLARITELQVQYDEMRGLCKTLNMTE
jgi:hypothetical protein